MRAEISVNALVCCLTICFFPGVAFPQQQAQFESLVASARQAQARGDFESAAELYRHATVLRPEFAELQANLGLMYYQTGKDEQAIQAFSRAIRLKPSLFVPHLFLGLDYIKLKRFNEAIPDLTRAALLNSSDVQAFLALGQAYSATGQKRLALDSYLRAISLDPGNADNWFHLGVTYLEQVEADTRLLLARNGNSGYLHALIAETFFEQRHFIEAAEAYKMTLSLRPFPPGIYAGYGFALLNQQRLADAEREFNVEMETSPGSLFAKLGLACVLVERGEAADGLKQVQDIWKTEPAFLQTNITLLNGGLSAQRRLALERVVDEQKPMGTISSELADLIEGAKDDMRKNPNQARPLAQTNAASLKALFRGALEMYASGRYQECSQLLSFRLRLLGAQELQVLAVCAYSIGNYSASMEAAHKLTGLPESEAPGLYWEIKSGEKLATQSLLRASELNSASPELHVLLGDVYRQRLFFRNAEKQYRQALALRPDDVGASFGLCLALLAESDIDGAFRCARTALEKVPNDPEINAVMGEILCARHDFSQAEPYLKKGLNTKPEYVPHVHALLGKVYAETNRTQQAITELKLALGADKDGRLHYQIARLYLKIGNREAAKQAFEISDRMRHEAVVKAAVSIKPEEEEIDSR